MKGVLKYQYVIVVSQSTVKYCKFGDKNSSVDVSFVLWSTIHVLLGKIPFPLRSTYLIGYGYEYIMLFHPIFLSFFIW